MTFDSEKYEAACKEAATRQGLDPIVAALQQAGLKVVVEQTGGFCMVATVYVEGGHWGVTADGTEPARPWLLCWYDDDKPDDEWTSEEDAAWYSLSTEQVLDRVAGHES